MLSDWDLKILAFIINHTGASIYDLKKAFGSTSTIQRSLKKLQEIKAINKVTVKFNGNTIKNEFYPSLKPICNDGALIYQVDGNILIVKCKFWKTCDHKHCKLLEYYRERYPDLYNILKDLEISEVK